MLARRTAGGKIPILFMIKGDKIGPEYTIKIYNSKFNIWAFLVIDNTKRGPGKGGIRMTGSVSEEEVFRLARAMTLKNALANLPFGGAKSGIVFDPKKADVKTKKEIVVWFARALKPLSPSLYIAAPDVNMAEKEVAWYVETNGSKKSATGKPKRLGGLPHELGSTGFGVAEAAKRALEFLGIPVSRATIAIEGLGNVGVFAFKFLSEAGARIIAVSDSKGAILNRNGLQYKEVVSAKKKTGSVMNCEGADKITGAEIFNIDCDVLIPAALPDVINEDNFEKVAAKIIVQGANIPMKEAIEKKLHRKGVLVIPDFVANAGGVISSYAEYKGWGEKKMWQMIEKTIGANVDQVLTAMKKNGKIPREIATEIAESRL